MAIPRNLANLANQLDTSGNPPKVQVGDSSVVVSDTGSNGTIVFNTNNAERMRIDSSGIVGVGITPSAWDTSANTKCLQVGVGSLWTYAGQQTDLSFNSYFDGSYKRINADFASRYTQTSGTHRWYYAASSTAGSTFTWTEAARITSDGVFLVGKTVEDSSTAGCTLANTGTIIAVRSAEAPMICNRLTDDGTLVSLRQASVEEGNISVSGSTVSYNGGHLSRWAQTTKPKDETLFKGTVLSNLDEMNVYVRPTTYWAEDDELPEGVKVGDVKEESAVVQNEQLNKVKVSDVEGDVNVAGVFVNWTHDEAHNVDEINMAMTGDMIIRIAQGVVVQKGDLLMSAGDGTAKPQGDDIVRSKTVAKVTSNHVTCTYADGSYCVPCVLMAC